jgi:hypothetical protein
MKNKDSGLRRYERYCRELNELEKKRSRKLKQILELRDKLGIKPDGE